MPIARRTGDEEERIVHGGELPESDGSLDDVVVDGPPVPFQKHPDELWSSYFIRRLAHEGIEVDDFRYESETFISKNLLNQGVALEIIRGVDISPLITPAPDDDYFVSSDGANALRKEVSKKDFMMNLLTFDAVDIKYKDTGEYLSFIFESEDFDTTVTLQVEPSSPLKHSADWFIHKYSNPTAGLSPVGVVNDIVKYVKELSLKQDDNS
jgi:hypothetical protein